MTRGSSTLPELQSDRRPSAIVLGASHWHAPLYLEGLARAFRVLAVQDAHPEAVAVASFAGFLNVPLVTDVDEALERDPIDVAFVFSPHHEMPDISRKLIDRGIAFVIEKPAATNIAELRMIEEEARLAGVPVTVPLVQRNAPVETWLRQAGDIVYERIAFIAGPPGRYRRNGNRWMLDPLQSGGGSLMNLGPHFVDMALRHLGQPDSVIRRQSTSLHGERVDDHATMILTSNGREAIVEVGYAFPDSPLKRYCSFTAAGTNGFASVDTDGTARFTDNDGSTTTQIIEVDSDPLYEVFVDAVATTLPEGFAGLPTLADLVETMDLIWTSEPVRAAVHG
jgi:predicted dehydrogenase